MGLYLIGKSTYSIISHSLWLSSARCKTQQNILCVFATTTNCRQRFLEQLAELKDLFKGACQIACSTLCSEKHPPRFSSTGGISPGVDAQMHITSRKFGSTSTLMSFTPNFLGVQIYLPVMNLRCVKLVAAMGRWLALTTLTWPATGSWLL